MAGFKCICGTNLSNVTSPNDTQLIIFTDREWEKIQEDVQGGRDIFDIEPQNEAWRCTKCQRIYFFQGNSVVLRYAIEQDNRN
jgi:hypothetical protein